MSLLVRNLGLEQGTQLPAIRPRQLGRVLDVHHDGLVFTGQVVVEALDKGLPIHGRWRRLVTPRDAGVRLAFRRCSYGHGSDLLVVCVHDTRITLRA